MRVLHVTKKFPDMIGGDAWCVDALVKASRGRGDDAFVVAPNCAELRRDSSVRAFGRRVNEASLDRLGFHRLTLLGDLRRTWADLLAWARPDLIHVHATDFAYAIRGAGSEAPIILTCHSLSFPERPWGMRGVLERWCLRGSRLAVIVAVHPSGGRALERLGVSKVMFIPTGVDLGAVAPASRRDGDVLHLLYVGRLAPEKGVDFLLDALRMVNKPVRLAIVGDGARRTFLETRARSLGLGTRVAFEGPIREREAMLARYGQADVFVLPSSTEGLPLALLEAWASGLPVVATRVGGIADVAEDSALLVPPRDARALAAAIETLASDPAMRSELGNRGRKLATNRFTLKSTADQYLALYDSVLAGGGDGDYRTRPPRRN